MATRVLSMVGLIVPLIFLVGCEDKHVSYTDPVDAHAGTKGRPAELVQAENLIRKGRAAEAQTVARKWLEGKKGHAYEAEAHYLVGQALVEQGKHEEAKKDLDMAVKLAPDRTTKGLAILSRADCNYELKKYHKASRNYHVLEQLFRDVRGVPHDEVIFKLGMCNKMAGQTETADYWFDKVVEMYAHGPYAAEARKQHSELNASRKGEPRYYTLEMASLPNEAAAQKEAEIYRKKGYRDVHVKKISILSTTYYSVRVGKYFNKNDAKRALEDAELSGLHASIRPAEIKTFK